jgi:hypothetical protein
MVYLINQQGEEVWRGEIGDGSSIEIPRSHHESAPPQYRDDPLFWQAQSPWEDDPPQPSSIPPERVVSRCKKCLRGYVYAGDDLAWLAAAFSLAPCAHTWQDIVPVFRWLADSGVEDRAASSQNSGIPLNTVAILEHFQTLSLRWEWVQRGLRKNIGAMSGEGSIVWEEIGRKNTYDEVLWLVASERVPDPTMETVRDISQTLAAKLAEAKLRHSTRAEETIGRCQARGAVDTYIVTLAQFGWFFAENALHSRREEERP